MSISGIYALKTETTNGVFNTSVVDIEIETYKLDANNQESIYDEDNKKVMPGEVISLIPKVENLAEDCYVRIKVNYIDSNTNFIDYVTGFSNNLEKHGDFYYYNKVLNSKDIIKIFDTIRIPESISNNYENETIKLEIIAEAIQAKNFEPDYSLEDPWKDVKPTERINNSYDINKNKIKIEYGDNTSDEVYVSDDIFKNLKGMMPGDVTNNSIEITNKKKEKTKYYVRFNVDENNIIEKELLSKVNLVVTDQKGQVKYNGNIVTNEKLLLCELEYNTNEKLFFKISLPKELGNEYSTLNPNFTLIFSEEYEGKGSDSGSKENPQTGDSVNTAITIFFLSSICLVIVMILGYREKRKENIDSIQFKNR